MIFVIVEGRGTTGSSFGKLGGLVVQTRKVVGNAFRIRTVKNSGESVHCTEFGCGEIARELALLRRHCVNTPWNRI